MNILDRIFARFARVLVSGALIAGINYLVGLLVTIHLPSWLIPILVALLSALGKWLRDTYKVDIPI